MSRKDWELSCLTIGLNSCDFLFHWIGQYTRPKSLKEHLEHNVVHGVNSQLNWEQRTLYGGLWYHLSEIVYIFKLVRQVELILMTKSWLRDRKRLYWTTSMDLGSHYLILWSFICGHLFEGFQELQYFNAISPLLVGCNGGISVHRIR